MNFSLKCPLESCKYPSRYTVSGALACYAALFPTVSKPVLLGWKNTVKQRRDVSKHLHFSNQMPSSVPVQSNLNWDLHYNQEFPVRFGCCKRQSWSTRWVDQQHFDGTTWPCLTHALRPTHSLRFASLMLWKCGILGSCDGSHRKGSRQRLPTI